MKRLFAIGLSLLMLVGLSADADLLEEYLQMKPVVHNGYAFPRIAITFDRVKYTAVIYIDDEGYFRVIIETKGSKRTLREPCEADGRFLNYIGEKIDLTISHPYMKCDRDHILVNSKSIIIGRTKSSGKISLKGGIQPVLIYKQGVLATRFWFLEPNEYVEYAKVLDARKVNNQGDFGTDRFWRTAPVWCAVTRYKRKFLLSSATYSDEIYLVTDGDNKPSIVRTSRNGCFQPLRSQGPYIDYEDRIGEMFSTKDDATKRLEEILLSVSPPEESSQTQPNPGQKSQPKTTSELQLARTGTGFTINEKYIVTAEHVLNGCKKVRILHSNNDVKAQTVSLDESIDLGLLKLETPMAHSAALRSKPKLRLGDQAINYGYPLFGQLSSSAKITVGYVNALAGYGDDKRIIQFSAPTQPGNSGGPVLDHSGNVIGVVSSSLSKQYAEKMGHIAQNVNFAIKSKTLQRFLKSNRVSFKRVESKKKLDLPDIAEKAEKFTVLVGCWE